MAIGFSYVSDRAFVLSDLEGTSTRGFTAFFNEDEVSYASWIDDLRDKGNIDHPLLPLVHPPLTHQPPPDHKHQTDLQTDKKNPSCTVETTLSGECDSKPTQQMTLKKSKRRMKRV